MSKTKLTFASTLVFSFITATLALAQATPPTVPIYSCTGFSCIANILNTFAKWLFWIMVLLAIIFFLFGGFIYLTSGGDPEKTGKAKSYLIYAAVAIVIGLVAFVLPSIIGGLTGTQINPGFTPGQ